MSPRASDTTEAVSASPTNGRLFTTKIDIGTDAPLEEDDLTSESNPAIRCEVRRENEKLIKKVNKNPEQGSKMEGSKSERDDRASRSEDSNTRNRKVLQESENRGPWQLSSVNTLTLANQALVAPIN